MVKLSKRRSKFGRRDLASIARRIDERITDFGEHYATTILCGRSLPAQAVDELKELTTEARRLRRLIKKK